MVFGQTIVVVKVFIFKSFRYDDNPVLFMASA